MNTSSNAMSDTRTASHATFAAGPSFGQQLYWSIRRELWEFRSIYVVQLAVAGIFLFGFLVSLGRFRHKILGLSSLDPMQQHQLIEQPYSFAAGLIMAAGFIVGIFYSLEALQSERRDRSILFWKSLPVSDLTTVLAKASIPMVIIPAISFVLGVAVQIVMMLLHGIVLRANGVPEGVFFSHLPIFQIWAMLFYHLLVLHSLGFAPLYAWLLLVSGWARRLAFLWAALPLVVVAVIENFVFGTSTFIGFWFSPAPGGDGFSRGMSMEPMARIHPAEFFVSTSVWAGLAVAILLLAATVRLRRYREPN